MQYRSELESLMTLSAEAITQACAGERLNSLITQCYDEYLELRELAEEIPDGDAQRDFYLQEAAAWRATVRVLRTIAAEKSARTGRTSGAA